MKKPEFDIHWMTRGHLESVVDIEAKSFPLPWSEDDFIRCVRQRNCIGMVYEQQDKILGFMIYELHKNRLHILNFAVHPDHRRQGVGRRMVEKLIRKLTLQNRSRIMLEVRETNLDAQFFFRAMGFRAISVLKDFYEDAPDEDAYLMQYRHEPTPEELAAIDRYHASI